MSEMFTTFGGASQEYMHAVRQIREAMPDEVLKKTIRQGLNYVGASPTEPMQFSRGKAALDILENFSTDISQLRKEQRETGTAKTQAQKYYDEQKLINPDKPVSIEEFKKQVDDRTYFNNNVNDWYKQVDKSTVLTEAEKWDLKRGGKYNYSELNAEYWDSNYRHELEKHAKELIAKAKERKRLKEAGAPTGPVPQNIKGVGADLNKIIK